MTLPLTRPDGYSLFPTPASRPAVLHALRRIFLEFRGCPITPDQVQEWDRTTWFPGIRESPEFQPDALLPRDLLQQLPSGTWCPPQILLRLPDWEPHPITSASWHVDTPPPDSRFPYRYIIQVSLTDAPSNGGCLYVRASTGEPRPVPTHQGDILLMHPFLPHAGSANLRSLPRVAVYLRLLAD